MPHVPFTVRATEEALRHSPAGFFLAGGTPVAEALAGLKSLVTFRPQGFLFGDHITNMASCCPHGWP